MFIVQFQPFIHYPTSPSSLHSPLKKNHKHPSPIYSVNSFSFSLTFPPMYLPHFPLLSLSLPCFCLSFLHSHFPSRVFASFSFTLTFPPVFLPHFPSLSLSLPCLCLHRTDSLSSASVSANSDPLYYFFPV